MTKRCLVTLTIQKREPLQALVSKGKAAARKLVRARILLLADEADGGPRKSDQEIAEALGCGRATVARVANSLWKKVWKRRSPPSQPLGRIRFVWTARPKHTWCRSLAELRGLWRELHSGSSRGLSCAICCTPGRQARRAGKEL